MFSVVRINRFACGLVLLLAAISLPAAGHEAVYRLNAGGSWYVDTTAHVWEPDSAYRQYGYAGVTSSAISGTLDDKLYQSERWGAPWETEFAYHLPILPGAYTVRLHFAEIYDGITGGNPRVFDVLLEGYLALDGLSIFDQVGYAAALVEEFEVTVLDTSLDIEFLWGQENPKISAIEVLESEGPLPTPQLSVTPVQVAFGNVDVGTTATGSVQLTNTGTASLDISSITLGGTNPAVFGKQHGALPIALAPGASTPLGVTFTPTAAGGVSASISVVSSDPSGAKTISLSGTGVSVQTSPQLSVSPEQVAFGNVDVGTSATGSVQLSNTGAASLEITSITLGGANPAVFGKQHGALPIALVPGASTPLGVTFTPTAAGGMSASISVVSNDPAGAKNVPLSGTGVVPQAGTVWRVNAGGSQYTDVDGNVWQSDAGLFNTGGTFSTTTTIAGTTLQPVYKTERYDSISSPEMTYTLAVQPGAYTVRLHFAEIWFTSPGQRIFDVLIEGALALNDFDIVQEAGAFNAVVKTFNVTVADNALNIQFLHVVENPKISGIEVLTQAAVLAVNPASVSFGTVEVGSTSGPTTITLSNTGGAAAQLDQIGLSGANSGDFAIANAPVLPASIPAQGSISFGVAFTPQADGARQGTVQLAIAGGQTFTVPVSGVGETPPPPAVTLYRINAGGPALTDTAGDAWEADTSFYNTGSTYSVSSAIAGTTDDALYQTERWDSSASPAMTYSFPVEPGTYFVRLHFAEIFDGITAPGQRVFDVAIEGQAALSDFDIYAEAGPLTAVVKEFNVDVGDNSLDIQFLHKVENPKVSGIEVINASNVTSSQSVLNWGHVLLNTSGGSKTFTLTNEGTSSVTINSVAFKIAQGSAQGFTATIDSANYSGGAADSGEAVNIPLAGGGSVTVSVDFTPPIMSSNDVTLEFSGTFGSVSVQLLGTGVDEAGHPYLHVVIEKPPYVVDYDQDGNEEVYLRGDLSHTHEIGHSLAAYQWTIGGNVAGSTVNLSHLFSLGDTPIMLTIWDDNVPPETLSGSAVMKVVALNNVPGVLAKFYDSQGANPTTLLDSVPATADYAAVLPQLYIGGGTATIGPSPFSGNAMVQMLGQVDIVVAGTYAFSAVGGSGSRLFVGGAPVTGPLSLAAGRYSVESRFAVPTLSDLPIYVAMSADGGPAGQIPAAATTHTELGLPPVINSMPAEGGTAGGYQVTIQGMGFLPVDEVLLHWGGTTLSGASLAVQASSIVFNAPPGSGTIGVTVETPSGVSNARTFTYSGNAAAPVAFQLSTVVSGLSLAAVATWGADGRLYVGTVEGLIKAYTLDDNYGVVATQTINTIQGLSNPSILGIASNPLDSGGPVKLYVAHNQLYANGGVCFSGFSPYSGQVSVLTGPSFESAEPLITGLPVSNHDHGVNALEFDNNGDLLIAVGGLTNAGVAACNIGGLDESPLSAAILRARVSKPDFNGEIVYVETATGAINMDQVYGGSVEVAEGVDVEVYASGFRNTFDLTLTQRGLVYCMDNGPNFGFGAASTGPDTQSSGDVETPDSLNLVEYGNYYGHPNRSRGRFDGRENVWYDLATPSQLGVFTQMLAQFPASTNGIFEYTANTFNGAMRGELIAQQWNTTTYRTKLDAAGRNVVSTTTLPVSLNSLDIISGPGGAILGVDYAGGKVVVAKPVDASATSMKVYDIHPWRASAAGGRPFVIGGVGFGTLANTSVTIGGVPCSIASVTATRIKGTIPANASAPSQLQDVSVNSGGVVQVLTSGFRYLAGPGLEDTGASAYVAIAPGGDILNSSTYDANSFQITNTSTGGQKIERFRLDLRTSLFSDIVFDPNGVAGDPVGKPFTVDTNPGVGTLSYVLTSLNAGGYDVLDITFTDFGAGKMVGFSADLDPTSIQGAAAPGPNHSGSISGLETMGATVTIYFSDGTTLTTRPYRIDGSSTNSDAIVGPVVPYKPLVQVVGITARKAATATANHTVRVFGETGMTASLVRVEAGLYLSGVPGGGYDIEPFEANTALNVSEQTAVIGGSGYADFPVALTKSDSSAGLNHFVAVLIDGDGVAGPSSAPHVLKYNP